MSTVDKEEKGLTRRDFVKGSVVGGAAGLVVGAGGTALLKAGKQRLPQKWNHEADVVVVGTGFAGLNAAIASHDAGAKVLVLEKAPERFSGGNSGVSGGGMRIPSNVPDGIKYYRSLCFGTVPDDLCVDLAEAMAKVPEQLKKLGIEVAQVSFGVGAAPKAPPRPPSGARPSAPPVRVASGLSLLPGSASASIYAIVPPGEKYARMSSGHQLFQALKRCVESREIKVLYETPARELIQDPESKAILGVVGEEQGKRIYVKAKRAVVLACGGYEANHEMQGYFNYPGIKIYPWGSPYNTGDGIMMVSEIGAPLWHMFNLEWDGPCVKAASEVYGISVQTNICTMAGTGGNYILVNKYGKRFMNDTKSLTHIKESLELTYFNHEKVEYPNLPFYMVFDETFRLKGPIVPPKAMCWNGVYKTYEWSVDNSAEIAKGWVIKADTIKELATKTGVDSAGLEETVAKYNEYCRSGRDAEFGRRKAALFPIKTPPYYSTELALTCTNTQGGPKHNGKAQTLDKDNKPIPRLYTPGEFGSFFGFLYPGGSNIPEAIAFGRIAGENAAAEAPWD